MNICHRSICSIDFMFYFCCIQVKAIGFDLDYTLVSYSTDLQSFLYDQAKQRLLSMHAFPESLKSCSFDENFAIRGLSVDPEHGLLIKLSNSQRVGSSSAYRGKRPVSSLELKKLYGPSRHIPINALEGFLPLHDKYAIAKACLIADAIDHFEKRYWDNFSTACCFANMICALLENTNLANSTAQGVWWMMCTRQSKRYMFQAICIELL
jgi:hypothetical protein